MTEYVKLPDPNRRGRFGGMVVEAPGVTIALLVFLFFVGLVGGLASATSNPGLPWWATAAFCLPFVLVLGGTVLGVVWNIQGHSDVEVAPRVKPYLVDARRTWQALPADLRERTRPIIDAAFAAAVLPTDPQKEVTKRTELLAQLRAEADRRTQQEQIARVGVADLEAGKALLAGLREMREASDHTISPEVER